MSENRMYELIITIVDRGFSDTVMEAAKRAGARGGTVIVARGTSDAETRSFLGISIQPEKELVLILATRDNHREIMTMSSRDAGLTSEGRGITFSLPVDDVAGVARLMKAD